MVTPAPLRLVYFGTPEFAVPTLAALLESSAAKVVGVVSQPDRPKGRGQRVAATPTKELAVLCGVPVLQPTRLKQDEFLSTVAALRPDLGVVAAYGRILPEALLRIPRLGMINVHGSLLPKYRGAAPVHRAVIAGDAETGITIMRVVQELDAGPMLATLSTPIGADETSADVERRLAEIGASLLLTVVERMWRGEQVAETPQDDSQATYAPKILKTESPIDWSLPAIAIHNRVRGLQPWPLASTTIGGVRILIHRTRLVVDSTAEASEEEGPAEVSEGVGPANRLREGYGGQEAGRHRDGSAESSEADGPAEAGRHGEGHQPGTVVQAGGDTLTVAAGDGVLLDLLQIQPEGRRVMSAREFLSGHRLTPGVRLASE
jgi:methionyl-tRNA formyltransferase